MSDPAKEFIAFLEALEDIPADVREKKQEEARERFRSLSSLSLPKERDDATLDAFFTPEVLAGRVLLCPKINVDLTDGWGMFGYEPGFIYIVGMEAAARWTTPKTLNEEAWVQGLTACMRPGLLCGSIPMYEDFPITMLAYELLTSRRDERAFNYLLRRIRTHTLTVGDH